MTHEPKRLRFALGQTVSRLQDTAGNLRTVCELSIEAARQGARLIVFPEGCLTGNALVDSASQAVMPAEAGAFEPLARIATEHGITICPGFVTPFNGKFNTVHAVIEPGGSVRFQHKAFRAKTEPPFLAAWPDPARVVFEVDGIRIVITICSEFGAPGVREATDLAAPELLLHPSAGSLKPEQVWRDGETPSAAAREFGEYCRGIVTRAADRIRASGVPKMGSNPIGFDGEAWWPGNSYAVDAAGRVALWMKGENRPALMRSSVEVADISV
jgi:predicted amidohydrolase